MVAVKKFLIEKRWALVAIILGVLLGFGSAIICVLWNLVIFGFNIMYIVSPLLAGFVETFIASRKYGRSTGAISALLTFFLINGYGWLGPGWIFPKQEPVTLSLITIIALVLTIQAAFPILVNYILSVVAVGVFLRFIGFLLELPNRIIRRKLPETKKNVDITNQADETFFDELKIPLVSIPDVNGEKIKNYLGLAIGEAITEENESEGRFSNLLKIIEPAQLGDFNLGEAKKVALTRMLEKAESMGANGVVEVLIDFVSMGGLQGSVTIVTATGTAVIFEEESNLEEDIPREDSTSTIIDDDVSVVRKKVPEDSKDIKVGEGEIKGKISYNAGDNDLSNEISQFVNEESDKLTKNLELATKNYLDQDLEKRFIKVSKDLDELEKS